MQFRAFGRIIFLRQTDTYHHHDGICVISVIDLSNTVCVEYNSIV